MKKLIYFITFLFVNLVSFGQNLDSAIVIQSEKELLNIGKQVYLLEEKEGKLTIEDIQKPEYQKLFKKSEQQIPNYNTTKSKVWVKLTVENQLDENVYLEIAQALAWYIDFYKPDTLGKPVLTTQTGLMRPIQNREVANNFFVFELSKNPKAQTYYFSIQSDYPVIIPLTLGSKSALLQKSSDYHLFFGMFSGLMLIMFFYNLFVAYSVRDKLYLYYCCYLLITLILINFLSGNYGYQFNPISYVSEYLIVFFMISANMIAIFLISILALPKTSTLYKVLVVYMVLFWIFGGINLFTGRYVAFSDFVQLCIFLTFTYVLIYSLKRYLQGDKTAQFVMFGFSFVLISSIIFVLQSQDLIVVNFFTSHAIVFGTELEILFFSFALGDRINKMRKDKENALKEKEATQRAMLEKSLENERLVTEQNNILEQRVAERTEELNQINEELNVTLDTISKQRDDIISSINYALRIQKAIIPKETELQKSLDCFVFFRPRDIVSGDFYWFTEKENCKVLAVADCTGHGVSGAFMTMIGNNILNQIVHDYEIYEPNEILSKMQALLKKVLAQSGENVKDGMDIAIVKIQNEVITYSGAMNPLYYVQNQEFTEIKADKIPISGVVDNTISYQKSEIPVISPTILYLTTDGYQDQFGGDMHRKFMVKNLKKLLFEISHNSLEVQKNILVNTFEQWKSNYKQTDDVLIVGIKI